MKARKSKKEIMPWERHQIAIAKKTLSYSDGGVFILGGMAKSEAREVLRKHGVKFNEN